MKKATKEVLTTNRVRNSMSNGMREAILDKMKRRGWTKYKVAQLVKGKMSAQAVYAFLGNRNDMTSGRVWLLMQAMKLEITDREKR